VVISWSGWWWVGGGPAGELEEEEQQQQQRNESSKSAELEGIYSTPIFVVLVRLRLRRRLGLFWGGFGNLRIRAILEASGAQPTTHPFLPPGPLRTRARRGRRHFRAPLHTFGGDDPGASSILVAFCFFPYTKESRTNERTNGRTDGRTDGFICGVSTVWSFVRWLIDRRRSSIVSSTLNQSSSSSSYCGLNCDVGHHSSKSLP
jgi:hypothetical protein